MLELPISGDWNKDFTGTETKVAVDRHPTHGYALCTGRVRSTSDQVTVTFLEGWDPVAEEYLGRYDFPISTDDTNHEEDGWEAQDGYSRPFFIPISCKDLEIRVNSAEDCEVYVQARLRQVT